MEQKKIRFNKSIAITKRQLAEKYEVQKRTLMKWIYLNPNLVLELQESGWPESVKVDKKPKKKTTKPFYTKLFMPKHVAIIIKYLGDFEE